MAEPPIGFFAMLGWLTGGAGILSMGAAQSMLKKASTEADKARAGWVQAVALRAIILGFAQFLLSALGMVVTLLLPASARWYGYVVFEVLVMGALVALLVVDWRREGMAKRAVGGAVVPKEQAATLLGDEKARRGTTLAFRLYSRDQAKRDMQALVVTIIACVAALMISESLSNLLSFKPLALVVAFVALVLVGAKLLAMRRLGYATAGGRQLVGESSAELLTPGGEFTFAVSGPALKLGREVEFSLLGEQLRGSMESEDAARQTIQLRQAKVSESGRLETRLPVPADIAPTLSSSRFGRTWCIRVRFVAAGTAVEEHFAVRVGPAVAPAEPVAAEPPVPPDSVAPEVAALLAEEVEELRAKASPPVPEPEWEAPPAPKRVEDPDLVRLRALPLPRRLFTAAWTCGYMAFAMTVVMGALFALFVRIVGGHKEGTPAPTLLQLLPAMMGLVAHVGIPIGFAGGLQKVFGGTTFRDAVSGAVGAALGIGCLVLIYSYRPLVGNMNAGTAWTGGLFIVAMGVGLGISMGSDEGKEKKRRGKSLRDYLDDDE